MSDFRGLLGRLAESGFPFVVVGGYAAFAHGVTLVTQDLDVCCEFTETSLRQLKAGDRRLASRASNATGSNGARTARGFS
jgi:hypothetical protein